MTNPERLGSAVLPLYFRRSQYSSWVRALNAYGFRKVGVGQWEHPDFVRDRPERLQNIVRKVILFFWPMGASRLRERPTGETTEHC